MKPNVKIVPISSSEHPAVRSARLAITRHLKAIPPSAVFAIAALTEQLATGSDGARWAMSADWADKHPEKFAPTDKRRARKGGA